MHKIVPEGTHGRAKIVHMVVTPEEAKFSELRAIGTRSREVPAREGTYVKLYVGGTLMMSDTQMEHATNREVVRRAHGHVLITGLGVGMVLVPILATSDVQTVTVVEPSADVIALVAPHFTDPRLKIVEGDAFTWRPDPGIRYDVIYHDIWPYITTANLPEITRLHQRYARWLNRQNREAWQSSWCVDKLRALRAHQPTHGRW
jgi:spermidine synthase